MLRLAAAAAPLAAVCRAARAQAYPLRPVRIVVGQTAGSGTDTAARLLGQWLSNRLGQPFIVENQPEAGGNLAAGAVARAPADGHTLLTAIVPNAINETLYDNLNFSFVRDVAPVAGIFRVPQVMVVTPSFPAATVAEFIAYAKANPGKINMASPGSARSSMSPANCSSSRPASTWSTCRIAAPGPRSPISWPAKCR
jgi:tripartite-type tricarboxylate transporter receptor subunit TctC